MLIEEILRTCTNRKVANAAVLSIGQRFSAEIERLADSEGTSVGDYVAETVLQFARSGDEAKMRSVACAMERSQEPILAGLHRLLSIMLVPDASGRERTAIERGTRDKAAHFPPHLCALELNGAERDLPH